MTEEEEFDEIPEPKSQLLKWVIIITIALIILIIVWAYSTGRLP